MIVPLYCEQCWYFRNKIWENIGKCAKFVRKTNSYVCHKSYNYYCRRAIRSRGIRFSYFNNYANRCEGGAILFCRKGSAHVTVNQYGGLVKRNTLVLVLPGSMLMLTERTDDFRMTFCAFSHDIFPRRRFGSGSSPPFPHPARESDRLSPGAYRRGGCHLVSDGGLYLPRPE